MLRSLAFLLTFAAFAQTATLTPAERKANVATFEHVWQTVQDKHWDPKLGGLDWKAVHDSLLPKIEAAATQEEARAVMAAMLERLKQTHFGILPTDVYGDVESHSAGDGQPGIDVRVVEGRATVTEVDAGSPAAASGVKPGWVIVQIDGAETAPTIERLGKQFADSTLRDLIQTRSILSRLHGDIQSKVKVEFLDGANRQVTLDLARIKPRGKIARLGNLPPTPFFSEWRKTAENIGYVRFSPFLEPETVSKTLEEAVKGCGGCKGFVIDLRGNPGGIGGLAMGVAGWFVDANGLKLGTEYLRGATINFVIFRRPQPFTGPLAVLVDGNSASTSEIFAGGLQDVKRARVFGTRTAGAALPSVIERLDNGDGFQYAIANYVSEGGKPLEGIGVTPDEVVQPTRRALLDGRDLAMESAVRWIESLKK